MPDPARLSITPHSRGGINHKQGKLGNGPDTFSPKNVGYADLDTVYKLGLF